MLEMIYRLNRSWWTHQPAMFPCSFEGVWPAPQVWRVNSIANIVRVIVRNASLQPHRLDGVWCLRWSTDWTAHGEPTNPLCFLALSKVCDLLPKFGESIRSLISLGLSCETRLCNLTDLTVCDAWDDLPIEPLMVNPPTRYVSLLFRRCVTCSPSLASQFDR